MRRAILGVLIAVVAGGCGSVTSGSPGVPPDAVLHVERSPTPFSQVTAGSVSALVPDRWQPVSTEIGASEGFFASPRPDAWSRMDGSTEGMAATWVDATRVGVPSDFYYLAATGPLLSQLTHSPDCRAESREVYLDNRPSFDAGPPGSPGDYMARGEGTCHVGTRETRWAYFVAAPGFGPVRRVGIPRSGLYVVVAITLDRRHAAEFLTHLIDRTRFGDSEVRDFLAAAHKRVLSTA